MKEQELILKVKAETGKAVKEINRLNKEVEKLTKSKNKKWSKDTEDSFNKISKSASVLNKKLIALVGTYASFQGAKELINTTAALETGFIEVSKTTGITGDALKELEDDIFSLATSMAGVSIEELQGVAATAGQLGIQGSKDILEFTRVITMMGAATDLTAEQAAEAMAGLGKSLDVPIEEFERLGSTIDKVSDNSNASAANLVEYSQRIAGVGKTFGLTADEVIAFGATLKDVGISAELGGTALGKVMLEMLKDTEGFAKASGVSFEEFSSLVQNEPVKALETFIGALGKLDKSARIETLDELGLKSSGVTQTMLKLADATDTLTKNLNTAKTEWKENTALMKSYTTASDGFDAQMETLKNQFKDLGYKIGKDLLPHLKSLAEDTGKWIESLDKEKIKTFTEAIVTFGKALKNLSSVAIKAHDYTAPDYLFGEDVGILEVLGEHLLALGHAFNEVSYDAYDLNDAMLKQKTAVDGATYAMENMTDNQENYKALKESIYDVIVETEKLIKQYNASHSQKQKDAAVELTKSLEGLGNMYAEVSLKIDDTTEAEEKNTKAVVKSAEEQAKALDKLNNTRLKDAEKLYKNLEKSEITLAKDIVSINKKLVEELAKIENDRFKMNQDIDSKIAELKRGALSDDAAYYDRQKEAEKVLSDAKLALKAGEFEKYKYYLNQYQGLVTDSAGQEIKINDKVAVSAEETRKRAIDGLKKVQQLENEYYTQKADSEKANAKIVLEQKKLELDATIALMEAQKASIELMKQLAEELTGKKLDIDTSAVDASIEKAKMLKLELDNIKATPTNINVDSTQVEAAKQKVEEIKTLTLNGIELKVDADTTPADYGIGKLITKVGKDSIEMDVNPKYIEAQKKLDAFRNAEKKDDIKVGVDADTSKASSEIDKLKKPTKSQHKVTPNTSHAQSAIDKLKQPTFSTHTVYEKIVPARANGGHVPFAQKLATGGAFRGSGRVPGYDPTDSDKVNAVLTGGEYVIKRSAVDKIGVPTLNALNRVVNKADVGSFKMPKIKGYASGGLVGGGSSTNVITPQGLENFGTLNLKVGNDTYPALVPREVAEALTKHINAEGGM